MDLKFSFDIMHVNGSNKNILVRRSDFAEDNFPNKIPDLFIWYFKYSFC